MSEEQAVYSGTIEQLADNDQFMSEISTLMITEMGFLVTYSSAELQEFILDKAAQIEEANRMIQAAAFYLARKERK
jgi:hypothetical protein